MMDNQLTRFIEVASRRRLPRKTVQFVGRFILTSMIIERMEEYHRQHYSDNQYKQAK